MRHMERLLPNREMKGTYKEPVKQPGEKSLSRKADVEENWHEDIGDLLFEEVGLEAGVTKSKEKKDRGNRTQKCAKLGRCSGARRQCCECSRDDLEQDT